MKKTFPPILVLLLACFSGVAQTLPVRTVTVFKNGKSLIHKTGKVPTKDNKWSTTDLPAALFGTFWVSSPTDDLASVFSRLDSVEVKLTLNDNATLLENNIGKQVTVMLNQNTGVAPYTVVGVVEKVEKLLSAPTSYANVQYRIHFRTSAGKWLVFNAQQIIQMEFSEKPALDFESKVVAKKTAEMLDVHFKSNKPEQEIGMLYLTNNLGWTPVYSLTLADKGKSRLSLRAEIANDAENLGNAELRLAVGVPNFAFADRPDWLVNFAKNLHQQEARNFNFDNSLMMQTANYAPTTYSYDEVAAPAPGENFEGGQAEDFYFYTVRPGDFPKNSRYQYPIFEAEIEPVHFYECQLLPAGPNSFTAYYEQRRKPTENQNPVSHYVEFANPTQYPFTTGAANILSQSGGVTYPLSQDKLPYTPPKAKCKVKLAQTPEIKVTHGEGDVERKGDTFRFFSRSYDEVRVEAQVFVVNYKKEPVTLKIRRNIEGTSLSSEQKWVTKQEQATLRVNPSHEVEWVVELKPGEEKNWKYSYTVYIDL